MEAIIWLLSLLFGANGEGMEGPSSNLITQKVPSLSSGEVVVAGVLFVPLVGGLDGKLKLKNNVRTILNALLPETILFDFDGDLRKMNVNEVREKRMNKGIKNKKTRLYAFGKGIEIILDVRRKGKKGKYIIQFHSKETKREQGRLHKDDKGRTRSIFLV